jgi:hypothetical protein
MQRHLRRVGVFVAGWLIVVVGLALVPLPGPGWVIVFVGLSLLSTEFAWAARLKTWVQRQLAKWVDYAKARSWRRRGEQAPSRSSGRRRDRAPAGARERAPARPRRGAGRAIGRVLGRNACRHRGRAVRHSLTALP